MDTGRIRRELITSLWFPVSKERWLPAGVLLTVVAYAIWVVISGAVLTYAAAFAGLSLTVSPWTTTTTVIAGVAFVLWLLAPAILVTVLLPRQLTNVSDNLAGHYRFRHPLLLVIPPLFLFGAVAGAGIARGSISEPHAVVLAILGIYVLVRTLVYSTRVFSFAVPRLVSAFVFATSLVHAIALLVGFASLAGRRDVVDATGAGLADILGIEALDGFVTGSTPVGGTTVPILLGLAAAVPVALSVLYLTIQVLAGVGNRLRSPDVPRSQLRTGQRYPVFARPTGATDTPKAAGAPVDSDARGLGNATTEKPDVSAQGPVPGKTGEPTSGQQDPDSPVAGDSVGGTAQTRIFRPTTQTTGPADDTEAGSDRRQSAESTGANFDGDRAASGDTEIVEAFHCHQCGERIPVDVDFAYCPACGATVERSDS